MSSIFSLKREISLPSEWEERRGEVGAFRRENTFEIATEQKGDRTELGKVICVG